MNNYINACDVTEAEDREHVLTLSSPQAQSPWD